MTGTHAFCRIGFTCPYEEGGE